MTAMPDVLLESPRDGAMLTKPPERTQEVLQDWEGVLLGLRT